MAGEIVETLRGKIRRVFFANPDSPWMAGVVDLDGDAGEAKFSGRVFARAGDVVELSGSWGTHPKYGRQFEATTGIVRMDESPEALVHLLASDERFAGIGLARARKIVDAALHVSEDGDIGSALRSFAAEVAERSGCPIAAIENASRVWNSRRSYFDALAALCDQGWTNAQSQLIVEVSGENAATIVSQDPYSLIGKVPRFGFRTVDAVAQKMGVRPSDPYRLAAGVAYCLDRMSSDGNTWTTRDGLLRQSAEELRPDTLEGEDDIADALEGLIRSGDVHLDESPTGVEIVANATLARTEVAVFRDLVSGLSDRSVEPLSTEKLDRYDDSRAQVESLNAAQRAALDGFSSSRISIVSGGAGVGKTYLTRAMLDLAHANGLSVALCAPTGKAAKRMSWATGSEARTIHRLLEPHFDRKTGRFSFRRDEENPLDEDLVVVDEVSMVDVRLMRSLLSATRKDGDRSGRPPTRMVLVGDHHQIPSVGPGAILRDLLSARERYPRSIHVLTEIVRQAGTLARNTSAVLGGMVTRESSPSWAIHPTNRGHEEGVSAIVASLVESIVTSPEPMEPFGRPLDLAWDVQVIAPMRKHAMGTYELNVHLQRLRQRLLGNPRPEETPSGKPPKPLLGDRVVWTKNDYELELFNGTQAIVTGFGDEGAMDLFTEDGVEVTIPGSKRGNVEVAYAMTIHKFQGSEAPCVILVVSSRHYIMRDRNLLYTGCSRASEALRIVGDHAGIQAFAKARRSASRSTLGSFLVHGWEPSRRTREDRVDLVDEDGTDDAQPVG